METWLKIGELVRRTGLTVRTLHWYDEQGLVEPERRTVAGHRLYGPADVARLHQVVALRQLGLTLQEIRRVLDDPGLSPLAVIDRVVHRLRDELTHRRRLLGRLESLADGLRRSDEPNVDIMLRTIEEMTMFERYFDDNQKEQLAARREEVGEDRIQAVQGEWEALFADVQSAIGEGLAPTDERSRALARRWNGLVAEFTGGDAGIYASLSTAYRENPDAGRQWGMDPVLCEFITRASAASGEED